MKLAVTIDVEEEGLFSGRYDPVEAPVTNVSKLKLLEPVFLEWGIRPTLLVSYQVARHERNQDLILGLSEKWKGETGAHLHMWNTPPIVTLPYKEPVSTELMPYEILKEKMLTLLETFGNMGVIPDSFRMGRFNMGPQLFSLLEDFGIKVDSSIIPTRGEYGGPSYLTAPTDPYFPDTDCPASPGSSNILEVPLTILPISSNLGSLLKALWEKRALPPSAISWFSKYLGSVTAQPVGVGLKRLKAAVRLHRIRGGNVITMFFHSSELTPGISSFHPTDRHIELFLVKLEKFLSWLRYEMKAESLTLSELYPFYR